MKESSLKEIDLGFIFFIPLHPNFFRVSRCFYVTDVAKL